MGIRWSQRAILTAIVVALVGCTEVEPVDGPATTGTTTAPATTRPTFDLTNFSMEQVANGAPLSWSQTIADDTLQPAGLVNVGGVMYVFAEDSTGHGLRGWSSVGGVTWADLGEIIGEGRSLAVVTSGGEEILVVTEGSAGRNPEVWASDDGIDWSSEEIPIDPENELLAFSATAMSADSDLRIVTGVSTIDASNLLEERLRATSWPTYDAEGYGYEIDATDEEIQIRVLGPANLTLMTVTADELGIDAQTQGWLRADPSGDTETWASFVGGEWSPAIIDGASSVRSVSATANGGAVAVGLTELEQLALWVSFDGYLWEQVPFAVRPYELASWNGALVGPTDIGGFDILTSDDGVEWAATGLATHFPPSQQWVSDAIGTSPNGLVVVAETFDSSYFRGLDFPLLRKGDLEIYADPFSGSLTVLEGQLSYEWRAGAGHDDTLVFEPTTETVQLFRDDGSGLVDLTLAELDGLAESYLVAFGNRGRFHRALALTPDGGEWTIWDLAPMGEELGPTDVGIAGSTVVVVGTNHLTESGFEVWTAQLP